MTLTISILVILLLAGIIRGAVGGRMGWPSFNMRRALTTVRSPTGANLALILAVVSLGQLVFEGAGLSVGDTQVTPEVIAVVTLVLLALVVLVPSWGTLALTVVAILVEFASAVRDHGAEAGVLLIVMVLLLLWLMGFARGATA